MLGGADAPRRDEAHDARREEALLDGRFLWRPGTLSDASALEREPAASPLVLAAGEVTDVGAPRGKSV